jgi:dihydroflavonol-4-reductase
VFLTGGTGLVGGAVATRLAAEGREVRALSRSQDGRSLLEKLGLEPIPGDVLDADGLVRAMRGCDVVYHIAGVNAFCLRDLSRLFQINVDGSLNVIRAAATAGVGHVVYTSSAATLGERRETIGSESSGHRGSFLSNYERSKFEAERAVLKESKKLGIETVCVNPSSVQGPGRSGGTAKILVAYLNGKLRFFVNTTISLVDIDDCAEGHVLAEKKGVAGERYVLNGSSLPVRETLEAVSRVTGISRGARLIPGFLAMGAAAAVEAVGRVSRRNVPLCKEVVRTLLHGHIYDGTKAERELGLAYTPLEDTLRKTIAWLADQGLVPRPR